MVLKLKKEGVLMPRMPSAKEKQEEEVRGLWPVTPLSHLRSSPVCKDTYLCTHAGTMGTLKQRPVCLAQSFDGEGGGHGVASRPGRPRAPLQDWLSLYLNQVGARGLWEGKSGPFCLYRENGSFRFPFQSFTPTIAARTEGGVERAREGIQLRGEALGLRGWRPQGPNRGQRPGR